MSLKRVAIACACVVCASACLFPSLGDLTGSSDASVADAAIESNAPVDANTNDVLDSAGPPSDAANDATTDAASASITYRSSNGLSGTSMVITMNKPSGVVAGDFIWALVAIDDDTVTATPPAGFQVASQLADNILGFRTIAYDFFAGASEPATYSITLSKNIDWSFVILAYANVRQPSPFDVTPSFMMRAAPPFAGQSITTTVPNALVLYGFTGESGDGSWSITSPLTSRAQEGFVAVADLLEATPGASGSHSAGYSDSASTGMVVVGALAPE